MACVCKDWIPFIRFHQDSARRLLERGELHVDLLKQYLWKSPRLGNEEWLLQSLVAFLKEFKSSETNYFIVLFKNVQICSNQDMFLHVYAQVSENHKGKKAEKTAVMAALVQRERWAEVCRAYSNAGEFAAALRPFSFFFGKGQSWYVLIWRATDLENFGSVYFCCRQFPDVSRCSVLNQVASDSHFSWLVFRTSTWSHFCSQCEVVHMSLRVKDHCRSTSMACCQGQMRHCLADRMSTTSVSSGFQNHQ